MANNEVQDWTQWIILTLAGVVGSMVTAIVYLTKYLGNKYVEEIIDLKKELSQSVTDIKNNQSCADVIIKELQKESKECHKVREELAVTLARLEVQEYRSNQQEHRSVNRSDKLSERVSDLENQKKESE